MKEFNGYIEINQWLKKLMDELNEEDGMRLEDAFYAFKQHCTKVENLPIPDVIGIPILAKIEYINDLGKSKWYAVVVPMQVVKHFKTVNKSLSGSTVRIAYNVSQLKNRAGNHPQT